ncbi:MAG: DUF512 domain-containing protein [Oscillospiraceae bacterium]|nr:DUF512 domain-containing protein [Oscillospiraceae bacterium]
MAPVVYDVVKGSICDEGGVVPGDAIISINGEAINDILDYRFQTCAVELEIRILSWDGVEWILEVEKDEDEDIGLVFEKELIDSVRTCANKCIFCFIDQAPKGMRDTLYFKDDDPRLSFTNGNYVTLTNVTDRDIQRIIRYRTSPVNISVHTTDKRLRRMMLNNPRAGNIMGRMRQLTDGGIDINCQIVLCKGVNDGERLDETLDDLSAFGENLRSISVVPVGLTGHRDKLGLFKIEPYDASDAKAIIDFLDVWQRKFKQLRDVRLVYPADEFFVLAGLDTPDSDYYDGFPQLENGVGMISLFRSEFEDAVKRKKQGLSCRDSSCGSVGENAKKKKKRKAYIATGVAAASFIGECAATLEGLFADSLNCTIDVIPVINGYFGGGVTVTGLLTGQDIIDAFEGFKFESGSCLYVSKNMLRHGTDVLLDDFSLKMLQNQLNVDIIAVENNGYDFVDVFFESD